MALAGMPPRPRKAGMVVREPTEAGTRLARCGGSADGGGTPGSPLAPLMRAAAHPLRPTAHSSKPRAWQHLQGRTLLASLQP